MHGKRVAERPVNKQSRRCMRVADRVHRRSHVAAGWHLRGPDLNIMETGAVPSLVSCVEARSTGTSNDSVLRVLVRMRARAGRDAEQTPPYSTGRCRVSGRAVRRPVHSALLGSRHAGDS